MTRFRAPHWSVLLAAMLLVSCWIGCADAPAVTPEDAKRDSLRRSLLRTAEDMESELRAWADEREAVIELNRRQVEAGQTYRRRVMIPSEDPGRGDRSAGEPVGETYEAEVK